MKIQLMKSQITDLYGLLGKNQKEETNLYADLRNIIKLNPRAPMSRVFELDITDDEATMVRELLTPPEREVSGDRIFHEMKKGMNRQL